MATPKVEVKQEEGKEPVAVEIIAQSIIEIAAAMKRVEASRLNRRALVLLVSSTAQVPQYQVVKVLDALDDLEAAYCKPKGRKA